jgi:preprotein translocase subunit YajC
MKKMDPIFLQNILFTLIVALMIIVPIFLIIRYRMQNKKQSQKHEMELRAIARQWENKK